MYQSLTPLRVVFDLSLESDVYGLMGGEHVNLFRPGEAGGAGTERSCGSKR